MAFSTIAEYEPAKPEVRVLTSRVQKALGLRPGEKVNYLNLHDALYCMATHNKPIPEGAADWGCFMRLQPLHV